MASSKALFLLCLTLFFSISISKTLLFPLTHSLSKTQFNTTHNLLKSTTTRSLARHHHRHSHQVSLPLSPGSDYTLSLTIGTNPPQPISLYMDTGSDLVWFPCSPFECILCEGKYEPSATFPPPKIPKNSTVKCKSPSCTAVHNSHSSSDLCAMAKCPLETIEISDCSSFSCPPFYYAYADGSFVAQLHKLSLTVPTSSSPALVLKDFTFGCAHTALGEPIGVAGFGRGLLSLPAQLATVSPQLGNHFSYCLVSHSFNPEKVRRPSPLILGRYDEEEKRIGDKKADFTYTNMLENPKHPYLYSVGLAGITVGKRNIPAPAFLKRVDRKGNGGMAVDSGTTFTMLPASLYDSVVAEFDRRVGRAHERAAEVEETTGLSPCYYYDEKVFEVPVVALHFVGNNNNSKLKSSVVLPKRNYLYEFLDGGDEGLRKKRRVGCLMLMNGGDEKELRGGPAATLGNYQQQGFEVVYDLDNRRVGFAPRQCSLLWERLSKSNR
ncbi:hypothetical protein CsatB_004875 [Cannabis sativa]|nr:probable aspartyl protease At4g16563 [Cannabis sativa]